MVNPGVYTLKEGARVTDVIQEAGGMTEDADAKSVNLAASLSDEEVIYVANKDENVSVLDQTSTGQVSDKGGQAVSKDGKINLNTATSEQLQTISGIGAKRTEDIIAYRESHGGFQSVDDLKNVSGIGDKTLDKIRESSMWLKKLQSIFSLALLIVALYFTIFVSNFYAIGTFVFLVICF